MDVDADPNPSLYLNVCHQLMGSNGMTSIMTSAVRFITIPKERYQPAVFVKLPKTFPVRPASTPRNEYVTAIPKI